MKKTRFAILTLVAGLLAGCASDTVNIGDGKILGQDISPYKAGRVFVVVDLITEPVQPDELALVFDQVYALAEVDFAADLLSDELIQAEIKTLYPDATDEFRQSILTAYSILKIRLVNQVEANIDLPEVEVISEFFRGVSDALETYSAEE